MSLTAFMRSLSDNRNLCMSDVVIVDDNAQLTKEHLVKNRESFASITSCKDHLKSRWTSQPVLEGRAKLSRPNLAPTRQASVSSSGNACWQAAEIVDNEVLASDNRFQRVEGNRISSLPNLAGKSKPGLESFTQPTSSSSRSSDKLRNALGAMAPSASSKRKSDPKTTSLNKTLVNSSQLASRSRGSTLRHNPRKSSGQDNNNDLAMGNPPSITRLQVDIRPRHPRSANEDSSKAQSTGFQDNSRR